MFKFIITRIARVVSRSVNSAFFITLYRELYNEVYDITKDEVEASKIVKNIGISGTKESCERQESIFKIFPEDPQKVLRLLPTAIYQIIFGAPMDDYEEYKVEVENSDYPAIVFKLNRSSVCGGFGSTKEFSMNFAKCVPEYSGCAAGVVGMLQEVANYILMVKGSPYRVNITERKCFNAGDDCMELFCYVLPIENYNLMTEKEAQYLKRVGGFNFDITKIEDILSKPIDAIKDQLDSIIRKQLKMTPKELFDHFLNYEEDLVRIIGFLFIHLLNEPGRLIEKATENETYSKIIGHTFNTVVELTQIYIPTEIIKDYHEVFMEIISDLASEQVKKAFAKIKPDDFVNLIFEGMQKALKDLGVNFEGMKENIWKELEMQKLLDNVPLGSQEELSEEEKSKKTEIKLQIIQEIFLLANALLSLPAKMLLSATHATIKSAVNSSGEIFSNVRIHVEQIIDLVEKLK
ncbi:MAG: hypothetical protein ACTSRZ_11490 [Promethearchaeota archaeon]